MPEQNSAGPSKSLPLDALAQYPLPGMAFPDCLAFSPDDCWITYLFSPEHSLTRRLFGCEPQTGERRQLANFQDQQTGEGEITLEETLRRERQRLRERGVTQYAWAKDANRLLIPVQDKLFIQDPSDNAPRLILDAQERPLQDPQISPDGEWVAFVQGGELHVLSCEGGTPQQITRGALPEGKTNGLAEYVAQEEMDRSHGFWWSPDSQWLAFEEVDETHIPVYRILHLGKDQVGAGAQEDHHYPFAGKENACVRLGVVSRQGGEPLWLDLGLEADIYLARLDWLPDGNLAVQILNREQTRLDLIRLDPRSGSRQVWLSERNPVWVNLHDLFRPLKSGGFIWASERSGFRHLYLYDAQGELVCPLTQGEWMVDEVVGVDEASQQVYFTASYPTPLESHLYRVAFSGGEMQRLTFEPGMHRVVCDHACRRFVDICHSIERPSRVAVHSLKDGARLALIEDPLDGRISEYDLKPPRLVGLHNRNGDLLYGAVFQPPSSYGEGPLPTIVFVYGGPHSQLVANHWKLTANLRAQYLRNKGFLVFVLDNRGSSRRGLAFEAALRWDMGHHEVEDQVDGVRWLVAQGLSDPTRVGIYGASYGGYMAAMCLARAPQTFKVAIAISPVTHWDGYDTHYTERYMGIPQTNLQGYQQSSVMAHAANLSGKLMLIHGLIDENVHFRHTARLINALIAARKPYDLLIFPDERHMPRRPEDQVYMEGLIVDYFTRNLDASGASG
jgi:dipeptidyl-peptidase 4